MATPEKRAKNTALNKYSKAQNTHNTAVHGRYKNTRCEMQAAGILTAPGEVWRRRRERGDSRRGRKAAGRGGVAGVRSGVCGVAEAVEDQAGVAVGSQQHAGVAAGQETCGKVAEAGTGGLSGCETWRLYGGRLRQARHARQEAGTTG